MRGHDAFLLAPFAVAAVLIVVAASVFFSGNACRGSTIGQDTPKGEKSPPPQTDRLRKLLTEQRDTLQQLRPLIRALYTTGLVAFGRVLEVERRLLTSELDLAETQEERIRILERILKERSALEDLTRMRFDAQLVPAVDYLNGKALRLDVAIRLEREKAEDQKTPAPRTKNVRMLGKEYSDTLGQVVTGLETMFRTGLVDLEDVHQAKTTLLNAEFDLAETQEQRIRLLQRTVKERSAWEKLLRDRVAAQLVPDANNAKALRLAVEIRVEREKAGDEKAPAPAADNVRRLLKEYRDALALVKTEVERRYRQGLTNIAYVYKATVPLRNTELDLAETQEERLRILERVLIERSSFEDLTRTRYDAQLVSEVDYLNAKALRLEAEIRLEREKVGGE